MGLMRYIFLQRKKFLWLGESKFYQDGKGGLRELLNDLENHFKKDYLDEQFTVVKKKFKC